MDVDGEFETLSAAILASEDWAPDFQKDPKLFGKLLRNGSRLERLILQEFKNLAANSGRFINWYNYHVAVHAYDVNVIVNDDNLDEEEEAFIKVIFDTVATATALGFSSGQLRYASSVPLGLDSTSTIIQQLTTNQLANLVGKKVDPNTGKLVPNPNAAMNIDETTRSRIAQSIKTSISLGETQQEAKARVEKSIANPARAALIARTETVRAFGQGRNSFAKSAGATGKRWTTSNATDECADNEAQGVIGIGEDFVSGDEFEPAHPNCKCIVVYTYEPLDDSSSNDNSDNGGESDEDGDDE